MFSTFRHRERTALAPLLDLARTKTGAARTEWLDDLRREAPLTMARVESILAEEESGHQVGAPADERRRPTPGDRAGAATWWRLIAFRAG